MHEITGRLHSVEQEEALVAELMVLLNDSTRLVFLFFSHFPCVCVRGGGGGSEGLMQNSQMHKKYFPQSKEIEGFLTSRLLVHFISELGDSKSLRHTATILCKACVFVSAAPLPITHYCPEIAKNKVVQSHSDTREANIWSHLISYVCFRRKFPYLSSYFPFILDRYLSTSKHFLLPADSR